MARYRSAQRMRKRLIELILERSFKFTEEPSFTLASGQKSNFYFNCKPTTLNGEGMYLIGNLLYDVLCKETEGNIQAAGGLTLGADPLAAAMAYTAYLRDEPLEAFVVRKEAKKHGTMLWVEGSVKEGDRVVIVEDVITTGGSTIKAIERARLSGLQVVHVFVLIDRQEGGRQSIEKEGVAVTALLTREEIFSQYQEGRRR